MKTPLVGVSTGLSLGCASRRNPLGDFERLTIWRTTSVAPVGLPPTASTTISNSCSSRRLLVVFSTVNPRFPVSGFSLISPGRPRT